MIQPIVMYSNISNHDLILELWGASTKHPDSRFHFSTFKKSAWVDEEEQVFQWLLECASKLNFPYHAKQLTTYAIENFAPDIKKMLE